MDISLGTSAVSIGSSGIKGTDDYINRTIGDEALAQGGFSQLLSRVTPKVKAQGVAVYLIVVYAGYQVFYSMLTDGDEDF